MARSGNLWVAMRNPNILWGCLRLHDGETENSVIKSEAPFFLTRESFSCLINIRCSLQSVSL